MNRDIFLNKFNTFYNENDLFYEELPGVKKSYELGNYKSKLEYIEMTNSPRCWISLLDIKRIRDITLKNDDNNPFKYFYYFNDDNLLKIFNILNDTELGIYLFNAYVDDTKETIKTNSHNNNSTVNNLQKSIQIINELESDLIHQKNTTIEYINQLIKTLTNNHYTKRQLFQNLLFNLYNILKDLKYYNKKLSKQKIFNIVNSLIHNYFDEDTITFTNATKIEDFKTFEYFYETAKPLILTHGKK